MTHIKKLYRSDENKTFAGVIGGVGENFNVDPVLLRLIFLIITIVSGILPAILVYLIAILIVPHKPAV